MKKHAAVKKSLKKDEKQFLDAVSGTYAVGKSSHDLVIRQLFVRTISPFMRRGVGLELGCSDGFMTELLAKGLDRLDVLDGSKKFLKGAKKRGISNARFIYSLFEDFKADERYDIVFATYVLEHVINVQSVLKMVHRVLKRDGLLYVVVPNAFALSRQLALHMNLLPELHHLTPNDHRHGHRRVYNRVSLDRDLRAGNFEIVSQGGILLKPFADFQMDKLFDNNIIAAEQIEGLYSLGKQYPDLCGCLYAVCRAVQG
ncbi:MAG: class I SAM-dependent methyltransferase [Kiritimatiellia bacterium]|nr:class I SAM-dependent methyltransferase [Kiritimatiellia bacterium]